MSDLPVTNVRTCYRHPDRRAGVSCQRCDRPICPQCMHQASVGFHCPECTRQGRQQVYTRANLQVLNRSVLTQVIIAINVAVFLAGIAYQSNDALAGRGGFTVIGGLIGETVRFADVGLVEGVAGGEWYRIVTSGFLHAGLLHLGLNMFLLYQLGSILEPALGRVRFVATYLTSLVCGSLGVLLLSPGSLTVGASGAVFGLFGALLVAQRRRRAPLQSVIGVLGLNLLIGFFIPGIAWQAHLGGAVVGAAAAAVLAYAPREKRSLVQWGALAAITLLVVSLGAWGLG